MSEADSFRAFFSLFAAVPGITAGISIALRPNLHTRYVMSSPLLLTHGNDEVIKASFAFVYHWHAIQMQCNLNVMLVLVLQGITGVLVQVWNVGLTGSNLLCCWHVSSWVVRGTCNSRKTMNFATRRGVSRSKKGFMDKLILQGCTFVSDRECVHLVISVRETSLFINCLIPGCQWVQLGLRSIHHY